MWGMRISQGGTSRRTIAVLVGAWKRRAGSGRSPIPRRREIFCWEAMPRWPSLRLRPRWTRSAQRCSCKARRGSWAANQRPGNVRRLTHPVSALRTRRGPSPLSLTPCPLSRYQTKNTRHGDGRCNAGSLGQQVLQPRPCQQTAIIDRARVCAESGSVTPAFLTAQLVEKHPPCRAGSHQSLSRDKGRARGGKMAAWTPCNAALVAAPSRSSWLRLRREKKPGWAPDATLRFFSPSFLFFVATVSLFGSRGCVCSPHGQRIGDARTGIPSPTWNPPTHPPTDGNPQTGMRRIPVGGEDGRAGFPGSGALG